MNIAYVRVSTVDQNEERQLEALKKHNIDKWFVEKVSAKDTNRPEFKEMLKMVDIFYELNKGLPNESKQELKIIVVDLSRLARSTKDLLEIVELFNEKGVKLLSLKENLDTATATGKLMLTMIGAINEFERANMLERQKEGIEIAKAKGIYKGRKEIGYPKNWNDIYHLWKNRQITGSKAMELLGLKRNTFYKLVKEYESDVS